MTTYRVDYKLTCEGSIYLDAESEEEARRKFTDLSCGVLYDECDAEEATIEEIEQDDDDEDEY